MLLLFLVLLTEFLLLKIMQQINYMHVRVVGLVFNNQNYKTINYMRSRIAGLIN